MFMTGFCSFGNNKLIIPLDAYFTIPSHNHLYGGVQAKLNGWLIERRTIVNLLFFNDHREKELHSRHCVRGFHDNEESCCDF